MTDADRSEVDVKLSWEIRKLEAEVEALRRPFKNPSVIAALTTATLVAVVSCGGLLIQWSRSDRDYTLAQIRAERLKLEAERLEVGSSRLRTEAQKLKAESQKLRTERAALDSEVASRRAELELVTREMEEIASVLARDDISEKRREELSRNLNSITETLTAVSAPIVTVYYAVGTYEELAEAGIIAKRSGLRSDWAVSPSHLEDSAFMAVPKRLLNEIPVPAPVARIALLTTHHRGAWQLVPAANNSAVLRITEPDKFWATGRHLVIAVK